MHCAQCAGRRVNPARRPVCRTGGIGAPARPRAPPGVDGYPKPKAGRAAEAIGAALMASALGGLFGCVLLAALLPIIQPIVLSFASPENFFLALAGIAFIAVLSSEAPHKR